MICRIISLKFPVCLLIWLLFVGRLSAQVTQPSIEQALSGELIQRKYRIDQEIKDVLRLIPPRVEPAGSCLIDFRVDSNDPSQLILSIVPLKAVKLRISGFGTLTKSSDQKYLPPVLLDVRAWPNEPAARAIRAGAGELRVYLHADSAQVSAGERLQFVLKAEGSAAMAILAAPEIKIRASSDPSSEARSLSPIASRLNWINPSKEWVYEWIPEQPDDYKPETILFSYFAKDQYLKTILTHRPSIHVIERPVFEIAKTPQDRSQKKEKKSYSKRMVVLLGIFAAIIFLFRRWFGRFWSCYWLYVAGKPETSFERTLSIYRKVYKGRYLLSNLLTCREREYLSRVERKIMRK